MFDRVRCHVVFWADSGSFPVHTSQAETGSSSQAGFGAGETGSGRRARDGDGDRRGDGRTYWSRHHDRRQNDHDDGRSHNHRNDSKLPAHDDGWRHPHRYYGCRRKA
jgi:hypothetical protein